MQSISFVKYWPKKSASGLTAQLVECYRDVFADGPWHEWLQCPQCKAYWGKKDACQLAGAGFQHCGGPLVDFWPREQVCADLEHEITPESSCWLALDNRRVVGFCWGYAINTAALTTKLGVQITESSALPSLIAYQDEVGVLSAYRGRKIAKALVARRLNDFLEQGLEYAVVRTRKLPEPSTTYLWYTEKLWYSTLATYPDGDGRVILGRGLNGLIPLLGL